MSLTASKVPKLLVALEDVWRDSLANEAHERNNPSLPTMNAILSVDTTTFNRSWQGASCQEIEFTWLVPDMTAATISAINNDNFTARCTPGGGTPSSVKDSLALTDRIGIGFSIPFRTCDNLFNAPKLLATQALQAERALTDKFIDYLLAKVVANVGDNLMPTGIPGSIFAIDNTANTTKIPFGNYNWSDMTPWLAMAAQFNDMTNPVYLDGVSMTNDIFRQRIAQGKFGDLGGLAAYQEVLTNYYSDPKRFRTNNLLPYMFQMERGSFAVGIRSERSEDASFAPADYGDEVRYTTPARWMKKPDGSPVILDVTYSVTKTPISGNTDRCEFTHNFWYEFQVGFKMSPPNPRHTGFTGIVRYQQDATLPTVASPAPKPSYLDDPEPVTP